MFTLSIKSDYGLLLLTLLAKNLPARSAGRQGKKSEFISLSEIAQQSGLPHAFISRIASKLAQAQILKSKEGVAGGYKLLRNPDKISIAQVTQILDGSWAPTKCTGKERCSFEGLCPMADNWQTHLKGKIWNILNSYTLKDLLKS